MRRRPLSISPPSASHDVDDKLRPRRMRTSLALVVAVIIGIFTFAHFLPATTPYSSSTTRKAVSYNLSEPNPFPFCPLYGPGDTLGKKYGVLPLKQSRLHSGSGARVQRVIQKALTGQPVTMSVIGGSVSACHGAGDEPLSPTCYPALFFNWWNSIFPHPATELTNGALRRTDSAYYGYCSAHHIPDVADLIIVELDVDDSKDQDAIEDFETLIRSLLLRPDQPAVIILGHFSPQIHETHGFVGPDHWHNIVAQFYDIPHISIKPILLNHLLSSPEDVKPYFVDPVLASPLGHTLLADTLASYMQLQICQAWSALTSPVPILTAGAGGGDSASEKHGLFGGVGQRKGVPPEDNKPNKGDTGWKPQGETDVDSDGIKSSPQQVALGANKHKQIVPPGFVSTSGSTQNLREIAPFCVSANDLINPLPPSLFHGSGWFPHHPRQSSTAAQTSMSHYWYSTLPTSKLRVPIQLSKGDVGVYFVQEPMSSIGEGSHVECWVDDNYAGSRVLDNAADIGEARATLNMIDRNVAAGSHYVECELLGEEGTGVPMFKIIGIFAN